MLSKMKKQLGFSTIEMIVAIFVIGLLSSGVVNGFNGALNFNKRIETDTKLKAWRKAIDHVYSKNALTIDDTAVNTDNKLILTVPTPITVPATAVDASTKKCTLLESNIIEFANVAGYAAKDLAVDGGHRSFCMFITTPLSEVINGVTVYYHSVAIVSPGKDMVINAGTELSTTGELKLAAGSDDTGILFDGRKFVTDKYNETIRNLKLSADAYAAYYSARYQTDTNRSVATDYFSCGAAACPSTAVRWDSTGDMPASCSGAISMNPAVGVKPHVVLGLASTDVISGWGSVFSLDNCTNTVRSPGNVMVSRQTPPYTAVISTTIPGGQVLSSTSIGQI